MNSLCNQKGVSVIMVIAVMLILAVMGAVLISLVTTGSDVSVNQLQSEQALQIAEGGKEYILANRTFPNYSTQGATINLGVIGSNVSNFKVDTPAYLQAAVAIGNTTITVNDTSKFATAPGRIVIDSEVLAYTAKTATTFTVAAATAVHANNNAVYPVTTVSVDPGAGGATINVASTTGFVVPGVIRIESEYIYCASTTANTFTGCKRGYKGSTAASHIATSNIFQYIITTTSAVGTGTNSTRVIRTAVYGSAGGSGGGGGGINIRQGSFIKNTAVGAQSVTGVGFQPKAVIFFWTRQTAAGFASMQSMGVGFATSAANQRAVAIAENDNVASSNAGRRKSAANVIIMLSNGTPTMSANAALTSFDVDGFTINWLNNEVRQDIIHYIAIGGSDITNAISGSFNSNVAIGNQAVAGLGFQPDFVMFLSNDREAADANDTNYSNSQLSLGFAKSSAARGAVVVGSQDARASNKRKMSQQRTDACILLLTLPDVRTQDGIADFVSMDADGFTINWSNAPALATPIFYLALKGGQYNVGSFNQATALGNQSVAGVGFQPVGVMMASFNKVAQAGIIADNEMSIGAAQSSIARGSIWDEVQDSVDPSESNSYTNTGFAMTMATGPAAINAQTDFVAFNNGGFILNWTTVDATARQILYWVVGPAAQSTIPIETTHEEVY